MEHQQVSKSEHAELQRASRSGAGRDFSTAGATHPLLQLQRTIGNRAVGRMLQAKLHISQPGDRFEQEADRVADQVMRMPAPVANLQNGLTNTAVQRQVEAEEEQEEELVQTKPLADQITPLIQRQEDEEEEEEELLQTKPFFDQIPPMIQRQADTEREEEEEEELVQTKSLSGQITPLLQRQAGSDEEEEEEELLQTRSDTGSPASVPSNIDSQINSKLGSGKPLAESSRSFFEPRFGRDLSGVNIHDDTEAASLSRSLNARAFTRGQDIFFAPGQFNPESHSGKQLIAHELTHTIQQQPGLSPAVHRTLQPNVSISRRNATSENGAATIASRAVAGHSITPTASAATELIARQAAGETPTPAPATAPAGEGAAPGAPGIPRAPVSLQSATFAPSPEVAGYLETQRRRTGTVPVRLGNLASGEITVRKSGDTYQTPGQRPQLVALTHPALQPVRRAGVNPVLAVRIRESAIEGYVTIATERGAAGNSAALVNWIKDHSEEMGWLGMDVSRFPRATNELKDGTLRLLVNGFQFKLGGFLDGTGNFGLVNERVTFNATATVSVRGLTDAQLEIDRDEEGNLSGRVEVPVSIAKFSGNIIAQFMNGTIDIRGTVRYTDEKFSGAITLLVTDAATARNVALEHLGPEAVNQAAEESSGRSGRGRRRRRDERAIAGWGELDFAFTEWLTGKAKVIVDNEGHITVIGEITPQAEIELFPQRDYIYPIFKLEVRASYGIPVVGNIFLFANIGMDALAKLGPGKIYNIAIRGRYSTDPHIFNEFSIEGTLNISAFAGLRLRAEGGAGLELLGHDIKAGVGLNALAGVRGYVEATPTIGYREKASPEEGKEGEFYFNGHMEIAAQPFLGLSGDLFVELDSPWWSPAPDKKWTWPIGELEYPLPGEFGIGADVDYVIGSGEVPEVQFGEVDFNKDKFMTDLMNDHVPPKSQGEQEKQGEWQEGETTGEAAEPTQVDSEGATPAEEPAQGRQAPGEGEPPSPDKQRRWLEGMRALGALAERSQTDPYNEAEIDTELARIRRQFGFTELRAEHVGEDWQVHAGMNPKGKVKIEGKEDEAEKAGEDFSDLTVGKEIQVKSKTRWHIVRITKSVPGSHIEYQGDVGRGRLSFSGFGTSWRRYVPEAGYKSGAEWEAIKNLNRWGNFNDARQVLNYRHHNRYNNPAGKQWHHIHEQNAVPPGQHLVDNLALTGASNNQDFNVWFGQSHPAIASKGLPGTGGQPLRQWLRGQPASVHREWGLAAIALHGRSLRKRDLGRGPFQEIV